MHTTKIIVLLQLMAATSLANTIRRQRSADALVFEPELAFVIKPPSGPLVHQVGDFVELTCAAKGIPAPELAWMLDGKLVVQDPSQLSTQRPTTMPSPNPSVQSAVHYNKLSIPCVSAQHVGQYSCVAIGGENNIAAFTQLFVEESPNPPTCVPTPVSEMAAPTHPSAPKIYTWSSGRFEMMGNEVLLRCRATGWPRPEIDWVKTDEPKRALREDAENFEIQSNGDLLIRSITEYDPTGNYMCVASNEHGEDTAQSFFYRTALEKLL